jgi:hypothetical protein
MRSSVDAGRAAPDDAAHTGRCQQPSRFAAPVTWVALLFKGSGERFTLSFIGDLAREQQTHARPDKTAATKQEEL